MILRHKPFRDRGEEREMACRNEASHHIYLERRIGCSRASVGAPAWLTGSVFVTERPRDKAAATDELANRRQVSVHAGAGSGWLSLDIGQPNA